jgi:hypothetical protein
LTLKPFFWGGGESGLPDISIPKNPNFYIFWKALEWRIEWQLSVFFAHFTYFWLSGRDSGLWVYFLWVCMLCLEKYGNPGGNAFISHFKLSKLCISSTRNSIAVFP